MTGDHFEFLRFLQFHRFYGFSIISCFYPSGNDIGYIDDGDDMATRISLGIAHHPC
jgi:hypothetical protein